MSTLARFAVAIGVALAAGTSGAAPPSEPLRPTAVLPVLWREPVRGDLERQRPRPPYRFVREETHGDSPKLDVIDGAGMAWEVKLGPEARSETAAAALLAAAGYFVDQLHYLPQARIDGLPLLKRGREFVAETTLVRGARFEARPRHVKRGETWEWSDNPFVGTRELDGLRTLMVLLNNYDARADNNRILLMPSRDGVREARYIVSDLGATFGSCGGLGGARTKGDLAGYVSSEFISAVDEGEVRFAFTTTPTGWGRTTYVLNPFYVAGEFKKQDDMRVVPVSAAVWVASRLERLGDDALLALFLDAGFDQPTAEGFAAEVRRRIRMLSSL